MYKLERIQRRAIRVLYKLNFASIVYISALMRSLGWLKFRYICKHRLLCIKHKAIYRGFPEYLAQSIIIQSSSRSSRKFHIVKLVKRSTSLAYSESAFSVIAPKSWNSLPYDIRCITSLSLFYVNCSHMSILNHCNSFYFIIRFRFICICFLLYNDTYNHHVFLN